MDKNVQGTNTSYLVKTILSLRAEIGNQSLDYWQGVTDAIWTLFQGGFIDEETLKSIWPGDCPFHHSMYLKKKSG